MNITARRLNRATLARQVLLQREPLSVIDGVRRVVAVQAQEPASPYIGLWNRLTAFAPVDLDAAFMDRTLVKATLMRITLHMVDADDYPPMHAAMQPTLRAAFGDPRFTASGLSTAEVDALLPDLLEFASRPRSPAEMEAWLDARFDVAGKGVWWILRRFAPLLHAPTGGPWSFGPRKSFVASGTAPLSGAREGADEALQRLIWRYLEGFGPASVPDIAQFAMVQRSRVRIALGPLGGTLERLKGFDGTELFDVPGAPRPDEDTPAPPRLMAMWDSIFLAHADRSRVLPPQYRRLVTRTNGDLLPTLLIDGYVAGVWRPVEGGIEAKAFQPLSEGAWEGLAAEARALTIMLADRDPMVYRRYSHWWKDLPCTEVRTFPG